MHVAATYDGTTIRLYINGVQRRRLNVAGPAAILTNALPLVLGAQSGTPVDTFYTGRLDDARVYATALTAAEVAALGQYGPAGGGRQLQHAPGHGPRAGRPGRAQPTTPMPTATR